MAIRITQNSIAAAFNNDVQSIYTRMARTQQQIADGRQITRPSDDPFGTSQVLDFDQQLADVRRYQANTADSIGFLNAADAALDTVTTALQRIRQLTLQAANQTNNPSDLQSISREVQELKEVVRDGMNASHGDLFIFGGTATGSAPFPTGGNAYVGTGNTMSRRIGPNQPLAINIPGDLIAGPNGGNVLDIIDQLALDIGAGNNANIGAGITLISSQIDMALDARTQLGAKVSRLETIGARLDLTEERLLAARTEVADVDPTEAYMEFTQQQTMYQAALAAGTRIMQSSILDFI